MCSLVFTFSPNFSYDGHFYSLQYISQFVYLFHRRLCLMQNYWYSLKTKMKNLFAKKERKKSSSQQRFVFASQLKRKAGRSEWDGFFHPLLFPCSTTTETSLCLTCATIFLLLAFVLFGRSSMFRFIGQTGDLFFDFSVFWQFDGCMSQCSLLFQLLQQWLKINKIFQKIKLCLIINDNFTFKKPKKQLLLYLKLIVLKEPSIILINFSINIQQ